MIFGGDFRQILPVVKKGNRSAIVNASIKSADFWSEVQQFRLHENMRIKTAALNQGKDPTQLNEFAEYLLNVGEGATQKLKDGKYTDEIQLAGKISKNMDELELIKLIYPDIGTNCLNHEFSVN